MVLLQKYLHRSKQRDSSTCFCGEELETFLHIFTSSTQCEDDWSAADDEETQIYMVEVVKNFWKIEQHRRNRAMRFFPCFLACRDTIRLWKWCLDAIGILTEKKMQNRCNRKPRRYDVSPPTEMSRRAPFAKTPPIDLLYLRMKTNWNWEKINTCQARSWAILDLEMGRPILRLRKEWMNPSANVWHGAGNESNLQTP